MRTFATESGKRMIRRLALLLCLSLIIGLLPLGTLSAPVQANAASADYAGKTVVLGYPKTNQFVTDSEYLYASKNKLELELSANEAAAVALSVIGNADGTISFKSGNKFLFCDGSNVKFADTESDYTKFVLEATNGGYFIKCAVATYYNKAQYLEVYSGYVTCYSMGSDTSIYTFQLKEVGNSSTTPTEAPTETPTEKPTVAPEGGSVLAASLDMIGTATRVSRTSSQTVHSANGITYTNDKASSITDNFDQTGNYAARAYQSSTIKIEYTGMVAIVFTLDDYQDGKYLIGFDGMEVSGATISRDGDKVTIAFASATNVFQSAELLKQVRIETIEVYTASDAGETPTEAPTEATEPSTEATEPSTEATEPSVTPSEPAAGNATVNVAISDYATANGWNDATKYLSLIMNDVISVSVAGGDNTGKYYANGNNWRMYQTESPSIVVSAADGATIVSVKITYESNKTGCLTLDGANVASDEVMNVNAASVTLSVGNTGDATNGQARITAIEVVYTTNATGEEPSTEATEPSTEATQPSTEATEPSVAPTEEPKTEIQLVTKPVADAPYKAGLVQKGLNKTLYFAGTLDESGKYLATTEDASAAVELKLEAVNGGYYLYFVKDGVKTYISYEAYEKSNGQTGCRLSLSATAPAVALTYNSDWNTMVVTFGEESFVMGTYGTYNTISASSTYYITGDKASEIDVSQYLLRFYAETVVDGGNTGTGDDFALIPVLGVMATVTVLAVLVICKRKHF